jgi:quercetin 2,3-dioxygenase
MNENGQSQIYKSDFRGNNESEKYRCLSTLNFENYQDASRKSIGKMVVFNEETIGCLNAVTFENQENQNVILIPLVGKINVKINDSNIILYPNEACVFEFYENKIFEIQNSSATELVNYLQIRVTANEGFKPLIDKSRFSLDEKNKLNSVFSIQNTLGFMGYFDARKSAFYNLKKSKNYIFAFVINGVFEFQNRLIEKGDSLSFKEFEVVEFEALSENAILLILEIPE